MTRRRSKTQEPPKTALNRALNSPILNGGYDDLMVQVGKVLESQERALSQVGDIHQAIYDPDDGLFARIRDNDAKHQTLQTEVTNLKSKIEKDHESVSADGDEIAKKVSDHDVKLIEITSWKDRVTNIYKWFFITMGAAFVTLVFKLLYDLVKKHIMFIS